MDDPREIRRVSLQRTHESEALPQQLDWHSELNDQQLAAVTAPDGPVLVLAGAGSGKTRVITYRVAYLIAARRVRPQNILLMTFTNKAAREMLMRCGALIGEQSRQVTGGTFHHVANLMLRRYGRLLGYEPSFTILDEADARSVMKLARADAGVDTKSKAFPSERLLVDMASGVINSNIPLDTLISRRYPHLLDQFDAIQGVLIEYHEHKKRSNQMDFDDLLVNLLRLLTEVPEARRAITSRYTHTLVDEYQDVNHIQARIVRELFVGGELAPAKGQPSRPPAVAPTQETAVSSWDDDDFALPPPVYEDTLPADAAGAQGGDIAVTPQTTTTPSLTFNESRGLFVVGDDAQSIYSFRGADYTKIRSFPEAYSGARVFKLETNYRSVPQILDLANAVLDEADPTFRKTLRPVKPSADERPMLLACRDSQEQAEFVAEQLLRLREEAGVGYDRIAVLYRAHNNRLEVELEFTKRSIPFVVRGGLRFFEQAHIKDILSYLVVLQNSRDELAWSRMMEMQARIGPATIAKVLGKIRGASDAEGGPIGRFASNGVADSVGGQGGASLKELRDFLRMLLQVSANMPVPELIRTVLDERYKAHMEMKFDNWRQRQDDIEQLIVFANRFNTLAAFLAEVGLHGGFAGQVITGDSEHDYEEGAVTLSTIHQSKGLEWRAVFLISCQDDVIPHRMSFSDPLGEDEERRLLYVAVTRAEEMLFMSLPQLTETRDFQRIINRPSRFLEGPARDCYDEAVIDWGF